MSTSDSRGPEGHPPSTPTEQQAREAGIDVETVEYDLAALAGTYVMRRDYRGRAKLVVDRSAHVVVGATFVGVGIAELVHSATLPLWDAFPCPPFGTSYPVIRRRVRSGCVCLRRCAGNATRPYGNDTPGGGDASRRT
ncbi:hypothetical protein [Streptomyces sp. NPDC001307]|uniref:hypothetical protein n=1 Tax=Streptomyces sp. NPDC001307 TaxID=3364560 RepID=UPI00368D4B4C